MSGNIKTEPEKERLARKIEELETKIASSPNTISDKAWEKWNKFKQELEEERKKKNKSRWQRFKEWFFL